MREAFEIVLDRLVIAERDLAREQQHRSDAEGKLYDIIERKASHDDMFAAAHAQALQSDSTRTQVIELIDALAGGRKIEAIKAFRALTGYGLKESKDQIERVFNRAHVPASSETF